MEQGLITINDWLLCELYLTAQRYMTKNTFLWDRVCVCVCWGVHARCLQDITLKDPVNWHFYLLY